MRILLALLVLPVLASPALGQKPSKGKILLYVTAGDAGVYKGFQQRMPDLEESAKDVRRHLGKGKMDENDQQRRGSRYQDRRDGPAR